MYDCRKFYIDGQWVAPANRRTHYVIDPATEQQIGQILLGAIDDVDAAVMAARTAFADYSCTSREERIVLLERVVEVFRGRMNRMAQIISDEMGAPMEWALNAQADRGLRHLLTALDVLRKFEFEETIGGTQILREPIGVCGLITPWNWPINQISCKVAPALAVGCTVVLKPSEAAPLSAHLFAEILEEAGVPKGVFNLIDGEGSVIGEALARHAAVDMVSITGSTRAGVAVASAAAGTVKRVSQELGGKSANIILDDADLVAAVKHGVLSMMANSGQSCNAPSRMLVPQRLHDDAARIAKDVARSLVVGHPKVRDVTIGPVSNKAQFDRVHRLIQVGIDEGATLIVGGTGRPDGIEKGYFIKPTIFANVRNDMTIAREEIFGPVLAILPYRDEEEAIAIANDTVYGLSSYVYSNDIAHGRSVARRLRAGMVHLNGAPTDINAPFGGYKQSGNGREWGREGFKEFLETKAVMGYGAISQ